MTTLDQKLKAKIPGADTGIEIRKTICDICAPVHHCGIDAYVKDGKVIKVEGTPEHPYNKGVLCTKGQCSRQYIYREDRIRTPMKRAGEKGEGKLVPISWEEAYQIIGENLNRIKGEYSPHSVAFFSGYAKWYRPFYHRWVYDFGSVNFGTDDSVCNNSGVMACRCTVGIPFKPDMAHANTFLGWAYGGYYSAHVSVAGVKALKERGGKVIIVDPKITPAVKNLADIHLQLKTGTDGALALGMAKLIIDNGWTDEAFIREHTYGYEEYKEYVSRWDLDKVSGITGIPAELIYEATRLYATNGPACINESCSTVAHHINGFQNYRAIAMLNALTGNFDRPGGALPMEDTYNLRAAGFTTRELEFSCANKPDYPHIGAGKFPLWDELVNEFQSVDLRRQIIEGTPYPVKGLFALGLNMKMLPGTQQTVEALKKLDFFVDVDLFMTPATKYADIVLPACSSFERSEFKVYPGGWAVLTKPVIPPLYESKSDLDILLELMPYLGIRDELLERGYEACIEWLIEGSGLSMEALRGSDVPIKVPAAKPYVPGTLTAKGYGTPSGKFEFKSRLIEKYSRSHGLDALTTYRDCFDDDTDPSCAEKYPLCLTTGTRLPNTIHSRFHEVPWAHSMRPEPMADINFADAKARGVEQGDTIMLESPDGQLEVKANLTGKVRSGNVHLIHGITGSDANMLTSPVHLDPYSGFPAYKSTRCNFRKK